MILFAGAGLDSCAQQIVRDALPVLVTKNEDAGAALVGFTARRIRKQSEDVVTVDAKFLAEVLIGGRPGATAEETVIDMLIEELTGSSMQSVEELRRVAQHLGVANDGPLVASINSLRSAFQIRNRIAHDMDIQFTSGRGRNRRPRRRDDMVQEANKMLEAAERLVAAVDRAL